MSPRQPSEVTASNLYGAGIRDITKKIKKKITPEITHLRAITLGITKKITSDPPRDDKKLSF